MGVHAGYMRDLNPVSIKGVHEGYFGYMRDQSPVSMKGT